MLTCGGLYLLTGGLCLHMEGLCLPARLPVFTRRGARVYPWGALCLSMGRVCVYLWWELCVYLLGVPLFTLGAPCVYPMGGVSVCTYGGFGFTCEVPCVFLQGSGWTQPSPPPDPALG